MRSWAKPYRGVVTGDYPTTRNRIDDYRPVQCKAFRMPVVEDHITRRL